MLTLDRPCSPRSSKLKANTAAQARVLVGILSDRDRSLVGTVDVDGKANLAGSVDVDEKLGLIGCLQLARLHRKCVVLLESMSNKRPPLFCLEIAIAGGHRVIVRDFGRGGCT